MATRTTYLISIVAAFMSLQLFAQQPLYIVNGVERESIDSISQSQIERIEMLDVTDSLILKYGPKASNGVSLITLKYDTPASFGGEGTLSDYIIKSVGWDETDPVARLSFRFKILASGEMVIGDILESTESRLKRKVMRAIAQAPLWRPATNHGEAVDMEGVFRLQLPIGRDMPREKYIILL